MRHDDAVLTDERRSPLLRSLLRAMPMIAARLRDEDAWSGMRVQEPDGDAEYFRVVCNDELVAPGRTLLVAIHLFEVSGYAGTMHNHRWPIAVFPFAVEGRPRDPLYEMPWERREAGQMVAHGNLTVSDGVPWAIEDCAAVHHAVRSRRPHASITVTDVSLPPIRDNRMRIEPMAPADVDRVRRLAITTAERFRR